MAPIALSGVIGALSYALDIAEGEPPGHAVRSCLIGMRLAAELESSSTGPTSARRFCGRCARLRPERDCAGDLDLPMRVLALADVYEALTADRPYRGPLAPEEALAIIDDDVPHRLDSDVRAALEDHLSRTSGRVVDRPETPGVV